MEQYKYIKGSAEDFVGAPSWAAFRVRNSFGEAFVSAEDDKYGYVTGGYDRYSEGCFINFGWRHGVEILAQREPIPEWNGDGLPPVGVECETMLKVHGSPWVKFKCLAVDGIAAFGFTGKGHIVAQENTHNFRPIRTEAERKREEAVSAIFTHSSIRERDGGRDAAELVYDAIAAGKIPGINLD